MEKVTEFVNEQAKLLRVYAISLDDVRENKSEYLNFNQKELITAFLNCELMKGSRLEQVLLELPELWRDLNLSDWKEIIQKVNRRENYKYLFDDWACFEDVKFLYKFLEIDSIDLYKSDSILTDSAKRNITSAISIYCSDFIKSQSDSENFDDGTYPSKSLFMEVKSRLISQGAKEAPYKTDAILEAEQLREYIRVGLEEQV
jgi:hypothetical protein